MIPVTKADEPATFDAKVRIPGLRAIAEMVGEKPERERGHRFTKRADRREDIPSKDFPDYWRETLDDLKDAYSHTCAYSCFRIHPVTGAASVDHFAAKSKSWDAVYEWGNYRLACSRLNARKKDFSDVLDPFEIDDDWFHLELVGFQVIPNPKLKKQLRDRIDHTITRLGLNDYQFRKERGDIAEDYWSGDRSFRVLRKEAPFMLHELRRQRRLLPQDANT
ncbi:MAG: hypothetical protein O3A00_07545 [Planctomycetota bacterium]|nr:hypothetical protein [Planctomycetota bacterium]